MGSGWLGFALGFASLTPTYHCFRMRYGDAANMASNPFHFGNVKLARISLKVRTQYEWRAGRQQ